MIVKIFPKAKIYCFEPIDEPFVILRKWASSKNNKIQCFQFARGTETFRKAKACICEINLDELYQGQANFYELLSLLNDFGFSYIRNLNQIYADDGHVIYIDAVFVKGQKCLRKF